ncbi:MAG: hypothetical protein NC311_00415 [Muribaculaceae bacterium]|nr:hypothetical protein [Muribaculaceae bacterium]
MVNENTQNVSALTQADKQKIMDAYMRMYCGLRDTNMTRDMTLGQAMYQASAQTKSFVETKTEQTIATEYLKTVHASYAKASAREMMTNPNKDRKLNMEAAQRAEFAARATNDTRTGMNDINLILAKFKEQTRDKTRTPIVQTAQKKPAKPVIKTNDQHRREMPNGVAAKNPQHHGPQLPQNPFARGAQLPTQNPHTARDYGAVKPKAAFKNGTAIVQQKGREFENIKKLQMAMMRYMQYQHNQRAA